MDRVSLEHKRVMKFMKSSWINMNIRCGKYKHLRTEKKCKSYDNISIIFNRREFKEWCLAQSEIILSLDRPSIDRKDKEDDYSLDNIQIVELWLNIAKEKIKFKDNLRQCYTCHEWKKLELFDRCSRNLSTGRAAACKNCESLRKKRLRKLHVFSKP